MSHRPGRRVPATALALAVVASVALAACPHPARGPRGAEPTFDVESAGELLTIPPQLQTRGVLERLEGLATRGDARAAWARAHYLLDLFDAVRFSDDAASRRLLFSALGVPESTGPQATDEVIDKLLVEVDRVLTLDRLHRGAQAARTLLEQDRHAPAGRAEIFPRMSQLKAIARAGGPLAANATIRLAAFCRAAFRDAAQAPAPYRPGIVSYCLYPLYDSDPEPYFDPEPARRPPPPDWVDLAEALVKQYEALGATRSRIARLGPALAAQDREFFAQARALMPSAPAPAELATPTVPWALPWEWTPLVRLGDGKQPPSAELARRLEQALAQDRRDRIAVALDADAPAVAVLPVAEAARQAGAGALELAVAYRQPLRVPAGDYWSGRIQGEAVLRLGVVPIGIETLGAGAPPAGHGGPRAVSWNPARATLELHLVVGPKRWILISPTGALPPIDASSDLAAAVRGLRAQLAAIRSAFPDEDGLLVVLEEGTTFGAFAVAVAAARWDDAGRPRWDAIALARIAPAAAKNTLAGRVERRAAVQVQIAPDVLAERAPAVRRCYQDAVDAAPNPKLADPLEIEMKPRGPAVTAGPKDPALRRCVLDRLGPALQAGNVRNARVTLAPTASRP